MRPICLDAANSLLTASFSGVKLRSEIRLVSSLGQASRETASHRQGLLMGSGVLHVRRSFAFRRITIVGVVMALAAALALMAGPGSRASAASTLLSQGKPATASSTESAAYPAANAVDGNTSTRWSSAFSDPQWLQVDLGASASITQVVLNWEAAYATAFQIQTSPDGTTWTPVYSTTTGTGGIQTLNVTGTGRYVRMYGTVRATPYGYSLWEFSVYTTTSGGGGGNTITVTNPGSQSSIVGTAVSQQISASDSASGLITGTPTTAGSSSVTVTVKDTTGASGTATFSWAVSTSGGSCPAQSNTPNFGPNVHIFDPRMSRADRKSVV